MRVLLAHNFYQSTAPSGEDVVYYNERQLLESAGHEVFPYERHNDSIGAGPLQRVTTAVDSVWSRRTYAELRALLERTRPDVAHFHNTFPLITPSAYRACQDAGVPVVQTLHNYRLLCPGGLFLRAGQPCERCLDGSLLHSVRHACYRGSRVATSVVAVGLTVNRALRSYSQLVNRYVALTEFAKERFVRGGIPADRIVVRPNGLAEAPARGWGEGGYALYVGRLTQEKGVETLLQAWQTIDALPLKIVGDGALRDTLQTRYGRPGIEFAGFRPRQEVWELMRRATLLIVPSHCYEGFPMTILEAYASGTPVAVSSIGALDEIVHEGTNGVKFAPGDAQSLAAAVRRFLALGHEVSAIRRRNRETFESTYGREQLLASLLRIYEAARGEHRAADVVSLACARSSAP